MSITVYVVIFSMILTLNQQHYCLGQDLKKCTDKVKYAEAAINRGEFSRARGYREECCSTLIPVVKSGATKAAELICDAVIKEFNATDNVKARSIYNDMINYCHEVNSLYGLFESTKCYKELPAPRPDLDIGLNDACLEVIENLSASKDIVARCCDPLSHRVSDVGDIFTKDEIANGLCGAIDGLLPPYEFNELAKSGFNTIAGKCLSNLSLDVKPTECNIDAPHSSH